MAASLVYVEHFQGSVKKASLAGIRFAQEVQDKGGGDFDLLLIGKGAAQAADSVAKYGAGKIHTVDIEGVEPYTAEAYTQVIVAAQKACGATLIAGSASSTSKDFLPRAAGRLDAGMASEVLSVIDNKRFTRPMWAGNVIATVEISSPIRFVSVRATEFGAPKEADAASSVASLSVSLDTAKLVAKVAGRKEVKSERPDVTVADRVVAGGRGVKGPDGFKLVEQLADKLGAGVGASRAVCDAGWVPNDLQIGQTGKVVAPKLYIAVGISGAIQHLAGMKGSKVIVAINKDPEAPIFQVADYGLVADLFTVMPELIAAV